jgi:hypothetical protein
MNTRAGKSARARCLAAIGLLGLSITLLGAAPAAAEPTWLPAVDLSAPGKDAIDPRVAMDAAGGTVAIWEREGATPFLNTVQASTRSPGGAFSAPVDLSSPSHNPELAVSPSGEAVAIWWNTQSGNYVLQVSTRPPGGAFSPPIDVTSVPSGASSPATGLVVSPAGDIGLAWIERASPEPTPEEEENEEEPDPVSYVVASVRQAGGGFSIPEVVSPFPLEKDQHATGPEIAIDDAGDVIAVWAYGELGEEPERSIEAAFRPAGSGEFGSPEEISEPGANHSQQDVTMDAVGNAIAVWTRSEGESNAIDAAFRPPGAGSEFAPEGLPEGNEGSVPQVEMASGGAATVIWTRTVASLTFLRASSRPPGGAFSAPQSVTPAGEESVLMSPRLAVNPGGDAVVSWSGRTEGGSSIVKASFRPAGGAFGAPAEVSPAGTNFFHSDAAIAGTEDATVVWYRSNGVNEIIQAAGYDVDPPLLQGLSVPPTGTVGDPVAISMAPFDVWPLASTGFSFGDGSSAPGTAASHVYGSPGTYRVTATATGSGGATVSANDTISISPRYDFRIGKRQRNRRKGTILLTVSTSEPGRVNLSGGQVKQRQKRRAGAGEVRIPVIAKGKALKRLRKKGKARVRVRVSFMPDGGDHAATRRILLVLVKKQLGKRR